MMTIENIFSLYALLISNALVLAAATITILRLQRLMRSSAAFQDNSTDTVTNAQRDNDNTRRLVNERISSLQKITYDLVQKQKTLQVQTSEKLPFENAVRMAKLGANLEELTRNCGLTQGEARLLMRVHGSVPAKEKSH